MMHADTGNIPGQRQGLGQRRADQQGADETGARRVGDPIDIDRARVLQDLPNQRQQLADVITRGQLRYDSAVGGMERDLAVQEMREQPPLAVIHGDRAFVTGGFDAQHPHGGSAIFVAG